MTMNKKTTLLRAPVERKVRHRAMEGNMSSSICGETYLFGHEDPSKFSNYDSTTYDWEKVTCKKCLNDKHNYDA